MIILDPRQLKIETEAAWLESGVLPALDVENLPIVTLGARH
jgi:hypothetical protein